MTRSSSCFTCAPFFSNLTRRKITWYMHERDEDSSFSYLKVSTTVLQLWSVKKITRYPCDMFLFNYVREQHKTRFAAPQASKYHSSCGSSSPWDYFRMGMVWTAYIPIWQLNIMWQAHSSFARAMTKRVRMASISLASGAFSSVIGTLFRWCAQRVKYHVKTSEHLWNMIW